MASPVVPMTSKDGIAIKHKPLLLSPSWEITHPDATTAKFSGHLEDPSRAHYHCPGPYNLCHLPAGLCLQAMNADPTHFPLLPENTLGLLGITDCSHQRKRQQSFKCPYQKKSNPPKKNTGVFLHRQRLTRLQFGFPKFTHTQ